MNQSFRELEVLVAKIQSQLAPEADVKHNVMLDGRKTGAKRQIDVLVEQKIGQYTIRIAIDCKDHARPIDVKGVEEFSGLLKDVGAQKGVLVCPSGFTETAKTLAQKLQIDLFSPFDTDVHKWQVKATIPVICDFRSARIGIGLSCSAPLPMTIPPSFPHGVIAYDKNKVAIGEPLTTAFENWERAKYPSEPGEYEDLLIFDSAEVLIDNGYKMLAPVTMTASLLVSQKLFYGTLPVPQISGFKDEVSGKVITNAFTLGMLDPNEVERNWRQVQSIDELPEIPMLTLVGLIGYEKEK